MSIDMTLKLNGTITSTSNYGGAIFWNPGSNFSGYGDADYPYYNEIMGVFNLFETPKINLAKKIEHFGDTRDEMYTETSFDYRIQNPIKYVLNPAARLAIQDVQVALIVEGDSIQYGPAGDVWEVEAKDSKSNLWQYRSPYVNVNCLNKEVFQIRASTEQGSINWLPKGKTYLKFLINCKRLLDTAGAQNVLLVVKYPLKIQAVSSIGNIDINAPCDGTLFLQANNTEINSFCNSTIYKTNRVLRIRNLDTVSKGSNTLERTVIRSSIFPNPTSSYSSLLIEAKQSTRLNVYVVDISGRKVSEVVMNKNYGAGTTNEQINLVGLPVGVYFIVMENLNNRILKRVVVQR